MNNKKKIFWWKNIIKKNNLIDYIKRTQNYSQGPNIEKFEKTIAKRLSVKYCVATSSGSNALILAINCLNLKPGDEIIIPTRTWIATAHAVLLFKLRIKLVDVDERALLDVNNIKRKITKKTKAIILVHLGGRTCDMNLLKKLCKKKKIYLIEDAAQALMSKSNNYYVGTKSDIGCFSLGPTKILNTIFGGLCTTNSREFYKKLKLTRNHGVIDNFTTKWSQLGFNFKYSDIQSKIGLSELKNINNKIANIKKIYNLYNKKIIKNKYFKLIKVNIKNGEIPIYVEALCKNKNKFIKFMSKNKIEIRKMLPSINKAKYISNNKIFRNSKIFDKHGIFLPCGPDQNLKDIIIVTKKINEFLLRK